MVLIGVSDERSAEMARELYTQTCDNDPHLAIMSLVNAEITKLSVNCFCTTKISFANELAMLCERMPGADVDIVTSALGSDTRIGPKYISGGLGFGGPCFPRDNKAFQHFAHGVGQDALLAPQVVAINRQVVAHVTEVVKNKVGASGKVAVLGLSYKPDTHIIEESQSVELALDLKKNDYDVVVFDPKALETAKRELGNRVEYAESIEYALTSADCVVLMTRWPEFETYDWDALAALTNDNACLIDSWRLLKDKQPKGFRYHGIGLGDRD